MDAADDDRSTLTRRTVLGNALGVAAGLAVTTPTAAATPDVAATPTVMTRNVYLGVDLSQLFDAESIADVRRIAGELLDDVDPTLYEARADAIAAEIEAADADVVALQEAALLRTQRPGDFGQESADSASNVVVDFLDLIESALAARNLAYDVAASTVTTDAELPADTEDGRVDLRITDRDVLLVRSDHETGNAVTDTYDAAVPLPVPGSDRVLSVRRGYCSADVTVGGATVTAVSTHLESVSGLFRRRQAEELLDRLPADRPVVLCGDFNSGPGADTETYDLLTDSFEDAHATLQSSDDGFTCCQASDLGNERSRLNRRIDAILYRGSVRPTAIDRVGHRPDDRVEIRLDGETVRVWPSDHAGVVGTFELAAPTPTPEATATDVTATPTREPTPTPTSTDAPPEPATPGGTGPGLGAVAAVLGIGIGVVVGLLERARRDR